MDEKPHRQVQVARNKKKTTIWSMQNQVGKTFFEWN